MKILLMASVFVSLLAAVSATGMSLSGILNYFPFIRLKSCSTCLCQGYPYLMKVIDVSFLETLKAWCNHCTSKSDLRLIWTRFV